MLKVSFPGQASLFIGPAARQYIMTKAHCRLKLPPKVWKVGDKRPKFTVSCEDTINNMKPPTTHSSKFPAPSRNFSYSTKFWAYGALEDIEHTGLWRTCQIETAASLKNSKDLMQSLSRSWWRLNKMENEF